MLTNTWIALTAVSVPMTASGNDTSLADRHLIGLGMFIARQSRDGWRFSRRARVVCAGEPEADVLAAIARDLPSGGTLIAWQLDHALVPSLLEAAASAPPVTARAFLQPLGQLLRGGAVDVALGHGGAGAPTLAAVATDMAIYAPTWNADAVLGGWACGRTAEIRWGLADEALAIWRVALRSSGVNGAGAEAATDAWTARLKARRQRKRARRAR
jgi:hypothetical protein